MGWTGSEENGSAIQVAEWLHRQLPSGDYLTTNVGADVRRVESVGDVRGVRRNSDAPYFEIRLASGQHFKVTIEEVD